MQDKTVFPQKPVGIRSTRQRSAIAALLSDIEEFRSAQELHDELRRRERRRADALLFRETHARCARELIRIKTLMTNLFGNNILEGTYCPNVLDPRFYNRQRGGGYAAERRSGSATAAKGPEREMPR